MKIKNSTKNQPKMTDQPPSRTLTPLQIPPGSSPPSSQSRPSVPKSSLTAGTTPSSSGSFASSTFAMSSLDTTTSTQTALSSVMSCTQSSPGAKSGDIFTQAQRSVSPESQALAKMFGQTQQIIQAIHGTYDILEKLTKFFAKAGPAIRAADKLEELRRKLQGQQKEYEAQLELLEEKLSKQLQEAIKRDLRDKALELVKKRIQEEIANSVNKEIPAELHNQTARHESQMLEVGTSVYNSEARAQNTGICTATDNLHPLWLSSANKAHSGFPATVRVLADKSNEDIETLLRAYNIVLPATTREDKINYFLNFIGVNLRVIPTPPTASTSKEGKKLSSTLVISGGQ
ncbi:hypothetical protein J3R30DRAFT_1809066 [Lentinula aciculospora]|uniref:Uncharacterized protein n=1 Tax=Lentinula aciculospora TaxID=153920 RepID=A0A9W9AKJ2_9AGAR|nr:hypothetical protein J3R30DRAFT_1809066 [Lentinula aciculospora]